MPAASAPPAATVPVIEVQSMSVMHGILTAACAASLTPLGFTGPYSTAPTLQINISSILHALQKGFCYNNAPNYPSQVQKYPFSMAKQQAILPDHQVAPARTLEPEHAPTSASGASSLAPHRCALRMYPSAAHQRTSIWNSASSSSPNQAPA